MALNRRLSLAGLVLAGALYAVLRPARPVERTESERRRDRMYLLRARQDEAGIRWSALAERASSAIPAARAARVGRPEVRLRGFGARDVATEAAQTVADLWTWLGRPDSTVRVGLVLYNSEPYTFLAQRWGSYHGASITTENDGATCVSFLRGTLQKDGTVGATKEMLETALGPCLLLAGFGVPGPAIERWLVGTRYAAAGSTAWLNRTRSFIDGGRGIAPPWYGFYGYYFGEDRYVGLLFGSEAAREIAQMLAPPYELGAYGLRCTGGDAAACRVGVLDSTVISTGTRGLPPDLTYSESLLDRPLVWTLSMPRPPGEWWLSDLIRDQGREKFAKFWTSTAPFEQAFQEAFGETLGAWTHRWSVRQWENSWFEKYRHSPRILGATLKPPWIPVALGWSGIALLLTGWVARRRQVT